MPFSFSSISLPDPHGEDHLTTEDGADIWFATSGSGPLTMVLCDGVGCDGFIWKYLAPDFAQRHRVLHWHYRGHGRSTTANDRQRIGLPYCVQDLKAVLDAAQVDRAIVVGHSMGVQVSLEFHRSYPERVLGLIPICGSYGHLLDTLHGDDKLKPIFDGLYRLTETFPWLAQNVIHSLVSSPIAMQYALLLEVNAQRVKPDDLKPFFAHLAQIDPLDFLRTLESAQQYTAWDHLPSIKVPVLVVAADQDRFTPVGLSHQMHQAIPASELLAIPGGSHVAPIETPAVIMLRIKQFIEERFVA